MPHKDESEKWWLKRLLPREYNLLLLGGLIGSLAGVASSVFRQMIDLFDNVFSGQGLSFIGIPSSIQFWFLPLMPMAGGLVIGAICRLFPTAVKENGVHEVMHAVALKDGKIPKSTILTTASTATITIGAGGSVGREGPTVQIGSAIGSTLGRFFHEPTERLKILVGCGAAGGIAASFNAPLAGVLFALEIILCDFTISTFSPIVIASVAGTVVGQNLMGEQTTFHVPIHELVSYWEIGFYLILGLLCGLVSTFFFKAFFKIKSFFAEKVKINDLLKPALGGLIVGALSIFAPQILGNGYGFMEKSLNGSVLWDQALLLIFLKIFATSITLGSGSLGGVFAPGLFIGAMVGTTFGAGVHSIFPALTASPQTYALIGMGAVAGAIMQAPLTNILILFELTNDYTLILPIMVSCIISSNIMRFFSGHSIYFQELLCQGINIQHGREVSILNSILVESIMSREVVCIPKETPFKNILKTISYSQNLYFPVTDQEGCMTGIISFSDIREVFFEKHLEELIVADELATKDVVYLTPKQNLNQALEVFSEMDVEQLPVVREDDSARVVGMLNQADVINVYNREILINRI